MHHVVRIACQIKGTGSHRIEPFVKKLKWEFALSPQYLFICLFPFPLPQLTSPSLLFLSPSDTEGNCSGSLALSFPYQHSPLLCSIPLVWEAVDLNFSFLSISPCLFCNTTITSAKCRPFCAAGRAELRADGATELPSGAKEQMPRDDLCVWQVLLLHWVTASNREEVQCRVQGHIPELLVSKLSVHTLTQEPLNSPTMSKPLLNISSSIHWLISWAKLNYITYFILLSSIKYEKHQRVFFPNWRPNRDPISPSCLRLSSSGLLMQKRSVPSLRSLILGLGVTLWLTILSCAWLHKALRAQLVSPGDCSVWGDHVSVIILSALGAQTYFLGHDRLSVISSLSVCRLWIRGFLMQDHVFLCF